MKKILLSIFIVSFGTWVSAQTLSSVTTSGNSTSYMLRITGGNNIGPSTDPGIAIGVLNSPMPSDARTFVGWKNDQVTNPITNGPAGTLLLQGRSSISDVPIDFVTGLGTPALRMRIAGNGNISIGSNTSLTPTSRLFVTGIGSTNATSSLDIQNSSGTDMLKLYDNGNLGVGTTVTPLEKIHIQGGNLVITGNNSLSSIQGTIKLSTSSYPNAFAGISGATNASGLDQLDLLFFTGYGSASEKMRLMSNTGNLGIGTSAPAAKLSVNGNVFIGTQDANTSTYMGSNLLAVNGTAVFVKAKVATYGPSWPDYVFDSSYKTMPLPDLEKYIKQNKHLPEIPSEKDVQKDGLDLGANQATLLKKIEELTLIVIEQNKKIDKLESIEKAQSKQLKKLKNQNK